MRSPISLRGLPVLLASAACGSNSGFSAGLQEGGTLPFDASTVDGARLSRDASILDAQARDASATGADGGRDAARTSDAGRAPEGGGDTGKPGSDGGADSLAASFVFVGCNRLQKADWSPQQNPSSANLPELQQTFADVSALTDKPHYFFFTGDLVLSLQQDTTNLTSQLDAWAAVFKADPLSASVPLVPLVGNHEMLYKDATLGAELSNGPADAVWTAWLTRQAFDSHAGNGPTTAGSNADALQDDQSKLSYSFDDSGNHYVVLNTDTWTTTADSSTQSTMIGWVALQWLTADLGAAQANPSVKSVFVFGHKPILSPTGSTAEADAINPVLASGMASLLDATPKVKGYLCAHAHEWDARHLPGSRGVYQIVAGNGGSRLESGWNVATPFYGFTEARVYTSGRVGIVSHQRPVPSPYTASPAMPATAAAELTIAP